VTFSAYAVDAGSTSQYRLVRAGMGDTVSTTACSGAVKALMWQ